MLILGASADPEKALASFKAKQKLNFPLLSDPTHKMIEAYGVWRQKKFMGRSFMGIVRSTFLIGADGKTMAVDVGEFVVARSKRKFWREHDKISQQ